MNSLKKASGTFKGLIGECMFRLVKKNTILTHFQPKDQAIQQLRGVYTDAQIAFLFQYWDTVDAIDTGQQKIYEIKTKSCDYGKYKFRMMAHCHNMLKKAQQLGIETMFVIIYFEEDWLYQIEEKSYREANIDVIVPKKYNKPYQRLKDFGEL